MEKDIPSYFSTRVYNSTTGGGSCDPGTYSMELSLKDSEFTVDQIFDYEFTPEEMFIGDGGNARVLLTLTPKVSSGEHTVLMTAKRKNTSGGTAILSTSTAKINVLIGDNPVTDFAEIPFWIFRKDCPGGFVVSEGEECPRTSCLDGTWVYGDELCEEDLFICGNGLCEQYENWNNCLVDCPIPEGGIPEPLTNQPLEKEEDGIGIALIVAIIAIVIACGALIFAFIYIRYTKKELKGRKFG